MKQKLLAATAYNSWRLQYQDIKHNIHMNEDGWTEANSQNQWEHMEMDYNYMNLIINHVKSFVVTCYLELGPKAV